MFQNKKFVFVAGPSESGKSSGVNYIVAAFQMVKHLKIRNIFRQLYEQSNSSMEYADWYSSERERDFEDHWKRYLDVAVSCCEGKDIIIMDTLYSPRDAITLQKLLGEQLYLLYVDAPFTDRVNREHKRLRTDSTFSNRKADLTITVEEVTKITEDKDAKKISEGITEYPNLVVRPDGSVTVGETGRPLVHVIDNSGSEQSYHESLDEFMNSRVLANHCNQHK